MATKLFLTSAGLLFLFFLPIFSVRGGGEEPEGRGIKVGNGHGEASGENETSHTDPDIACSILPIPSNGKRVCAFGKNNNFYCKFSCNSFFELTGSKRRKCKPKGLWTGNLTTCNKLTSCHALPVPEHATKRCTDGNNIGSICNFTCNDGYELFGSKSRKCNGSSWWTGYDTSCQGFSPTPKCDVLPVKICDGYYDCPDQSDEKGCTCPHYKFKCDCHETGCPIKWGCIPQSKRCDKENDCGDWSDEKRCPCPRYRFKCDCYETGCTSKSGCISKSSQCDGKNHCGDWSDERDCNCSNTGFQCKDGDCIDRLKVNDGKPDCVNGDDEFNCNKTETRVKCNCMHDNKCTSPGRCIPNNWIGDTISDCENNNDEPCNASRVWCEDCWVIINQCSTRSRKNTLLKKSRDIPTRCYSLTIPSDQSLKMEVKWICTTSPCGSCLDMFHCESGQFIDNKQYCDTTPQCNDGSDENMKQFGFRCSGKSRIANCVLPQINVYDSVAQCADSSDLCFVNGEFRCFFCLDGRLIVSAKQVCDGIVDCYDISDECLCANQSVCNAVLGKERSRCPSHQMHCSNGSDCVDIDKALCNSSVNCQIGNNNISCNQVHKSSKLVRCRAKISKGNFIDVAAARCDGRPECWTMEDECECEPAPSFCLSPCAVEARQSVNGNHVCDGYVNTVGKNSSCEREVEKDCPMRYACNSTEMVSIDERSRCDGILDCDDHSDENYTECFNKRFHCKKGKAFSVDKLFICDGIKDCDNGEDEARQLCGETRFYCDSGQPISVDKKSLNNGIKDCSEGSDECISLFSDRYQMIANPLLHALFWIMGLLALIGNLINSFHIAKDVHFCKKADAIKLANDIFVFNLAVSDFLMGVYLIAVVSRGVEYSGNYCFHDKEWRSSNLCSGLGALAVLSSETSAFILAVMSTFRLITIYNPFLSSSIKVKWIVIAGCSCWVVSILLAIIPQFPFDSGYFIKDVWFPNMFLKTDTVSKLDMFTLAKRVSGNHSDSKSWFKVKNIITDVFKYNPIKGEFGYYGETSVCMPRFYASTSEAAWQYSTFLITLNFLLFVYMVVAYVLVYKQASGMNPSRSLYRKSSGRRQSQFTRKDPNKELQKRISRLLLTDFFCWIPISLMGYLSVAGVALPPNAYIASAGFLLPINSAMNPILYSSFVGRHASQTKKRIFQKLSLICPCLPDELDKDVNAAESCVTGIETFEMKVVESRS